MLKLGDIVVANGKRGEIVRLWTSDTEIPTLLTILGDPYKMDLFTVAPLFVLEDNGVKVVEGVAR